MDVLPYLNSSPPSNTQLKTCDTYFTFWSLIDYYSYLLSLFDSRGESYCVLLVHCQASPPNSSRDLTNLGNKLSWNCVGVVKRTRKKDQELRSNDGVEQTFFVFCGTLGSVGELARQNGDAILWPHTGTFMFTFAYLGFLSFRNL